IDFFLFFFQAEDGIRDFHVTGVQTCALPICTTQGKAQIRSLAAGPTEPGLQIGLDTLTLQMRLGIKLVHLQVAERLRIQPLPRRSEERRVGKEGRTRGAPDASKKKGEGPSRT